MSDPDIRQSTSNSSKSMAQSSNAWNVSSPVRLKVLNSSLVTVNVALIRVKLHGTYDCARICMS